MFDQMPKSLRQINVKNKADVFQLCTTEGDDFTQIKNLSIIAEELLKVFNVKLYISDNPHDFGNYYGLEVCEKDFEKYPEIEMRTIEIADKLGIGV